MPLLKISLGKEHFFEMVEAVFVRRTFQLLAFFHLLSSVKSITDHKAKTMEVISRTMRIESRANLTRCRLIESVMRQHLVSNNHDASPVHLSLHPKADLHVTEAVVRACSERKPIVIWTNTNRPKDRNRNGTETCTRVTQIIGIYADIDDINPRELKSSYGKTWNARAKIVILITKMTSDEEHSINKVKLEETLQIFWSLDSLNVVLITMPKCEKNCTNMSEPRIFSYDPFALQPGKTDRVRGKLLEIPSRKPLFPDKIRDLRGFPIPISCYNAEPHAVLINHTKLGGGIHVNAVRFLATWLNFTIDLKTAPVDASRYKVALPDGRVVGPMGDVLKNRSDFLANMVFLGYVAGTRLEFIRPAARVYVGVLVPRAGPMPGIIRVFRSIDGRLAIGIFVCWILLACFFSARKKKHPFLNAYRLFIHQQLDGISDKMSERLFSISWILWAFVVSVAIQSHLIKDLTDPPFYKSIDTLDELLSSPLSLMADPININQINHSASETKRVLAASAIHELDYKKCTKQLVEHGDVACTIDEGVIKHEAQIINSKHGKNQWRRGIAHIAKEYLTDDWRTFVAKEGFPYFDKFNIGHDRMRETGLMIKWVADTKGVHFEEGSKDARFKLTMLHFEGTFKILLIGQFIALVVFGIEIIVYRIKLHYKDSRKQQRSS